MASFCSANRMYRSFLRKPKEVFVAQDKLEKLDRNLTLFDLLAIGIGSTVGSGVFVLTGLIASNYAGPGVVFSWAIAGFCCLLSALSYAELSCKMPAAGSSYAYVFHTLGELPAVICAWFLTLEYGISGAAVARSWGEKLAMFLTNNGIGLLSCLDATESGVSIFGAMLQALCFMLLLRGVSVGKITINFFTVFKVVLILFIITTGLMLFNLENVSGKWDVKGLSGIMKGATTAFFGYVGYDEVILLALAVVSNTNSTAHSLSNINILKSLLKLSHT